MKPRLGVPDFALDEITIDEVHEGMRSGAYTCRSITEMYLERIEALNRRGPRLFAVLETNPDALEVAEELDRELAASGPRGPLHGIPILLKDNIDTADRMTTTAGSTALRGSIPPQDAFVAARLREAGGAPARQGEHERVGGLEVVRVRGVGLERARLGRRPGRLLP